MLMPSCVCSLTLCQFWSLLIKKQQPGDREERKIDFNFFATKKNCLRELGKRGAKAGLHCYHSNAELQKHGAMVGGQCFHPSG